MFLQSHEGSLDERIAELLPALPDEWKNGSIKGIKARGNLTFDIEWNNGVLTNASVTRGKLEGEINVLKEQIKGYEGNEKHFNERIAVIKELIAEKETERDKILENKKAIDEKIEKLEKERNEAKGSTRFR